MHSYKIETTATNAFDMGMGRSMLEVYTGNRISEREAAKLMHRIADHKWYVSEKLDRDIGFHVAAIDYVENFYQPQGTDGHGTLNSLLASVRTTLVAAGKAYFIAKGNTLPL